MRRCCSAAPHHFQRCIFSLVVALSLGKCLALGTILKPMSELGCLHIIPSKQCGSHVSMSLKKTFYTPWSWFHPRCSATALQNTTVPPSIFDCVESHYRMWNTTVTFFNDVTTSVSPSNFCNSTHFFSFFSFIKWISIYWYHVIH